jgi:hypothetical protein
VGDQGLNDLKLKEQMKGTENLEGGLSLGLYIWIEIRILVFSYGSSGRFFLNQELCPEAAHSCISSECR